MKPLLLAVSFLLAATRVLADDYVKKGVLVVNQDDDRYCIGLKDDRVKSGRRWEMKRCDRHEWSQCWDLKYRTSSDKRDGIFRIHPCDDEDLCVEVIGDVEKRDKFKLRHCDSRKDEQYFRFDENNNDDITPVDDDYLCTEPKRVKSGRQLWLNSCSRRSSKQAWEFERFDGKGDDDDDDKDDCKKKCDDLSPKKYYWCIDADEKEREKWNISCKIYNEADCENVCKDFVTKWKKDNCDKDKNCDYNAKLKYDWCMDDAMEDDREKWDIKCTHESSKGGHCERECKEFATDWWYGCLDKCD